MAFLVKTFEHYQINKNKNGDSSEQNWKIENLLGIYLIWEQSYKIYPFKNLNWNLFNYF